MDLGEPGALAVSCADFASSFQEACGLVGQACGAELQCVCKGLLDACGTDGPASLRESAVHQPAPHVGLQLGAGGVEACGRRVGGGARQRGGSLLQPLEGGVDDDGRSGGRDVGACVQ